MHKLVTVCKAQAADLFPDDPCDGYLIALFRSEGLQTSKIRREYQVRRKRRAHGRIQQKRFLL